MSSEQEGFRSAAPGGAEYAADKEAVGGRTFEPIRGQPMLRWRGKRPFSSTQYFPAQEKERHGEETDGWINRLYWGDNLQVMSHLLREFRGRVDLIYIDPPFDSKADYKKTVKLRGRQVANDHTAFEEKQYTDIWTNDEYLQFMYERLIICRELLSEKGSIYLHCDWHKVHHLRMVMDEVFGPDNFVNEVIWHYSGAGTPKGCWAKRHDNILVYSKTKAFVFNADAVRIGYAAATVERFSHTINNVRGGVNFGTQTLNPLGKYPEDVLEISIEAPSANVRTGYPTQKPEALLEKIIKASSDPGDLVFDCFMGSGMTQAVAMRLGRRFIGADINLGAIQTATKRLLGVAKDLDGRLPDAASPAYTGFAVYNVNNYDVFRNPTEAKDLLVEALELQPLPQTGLWDGERDGAFYKIMPVNRLATKADLAEIVANFDYRLAETRQRERPGRSVLDVKLVCMGHEPDLKAALEEQLKGLDVTVDVVDILRDKSGLVFRRDAEAEVVRDGATVAIRAFYPMNLLKKLMLQRENVEDWRELVESVMVDFNYDGAVFTPSVVDVPEGNALVKGTYAVPEGAGTIRVKITDLLSESLETEVK